WRDSQNRQPPGAVPQLRPAEPVLAPTSGRPALLLLAVVFGLHERVDLVHRYGAVLVGVDGVEVPGYTRHGLGFFLVEGTVVIRVGLLEGDRKSTRLNSSHV